MYVTKSFCLLQNIYETDALLHMSVTFSLEKLKIMLIKGN